MAVAKGAEAEAGFRYTISRAIFARREILFAVFYGLCVGAIAFAYGYTFRTETWMVPAIIAGAAAILCFWNMYFGTILAVVGVVGQIFYANNATAGWVFLIIGLVALFLLYIWEHGNLGFLLTAGAPILTFFGLAPIIPAALGIRYGKLRGVLLSLVAFLLTVFTSIYVTNPGLLQSGKPPAETVIDSETGGIADRLLVPPDFPVLVENLLDLGKSAPEFGVLLAAWLIAAFLAGSLVVNRDYRENLANEYLKRVGDSHARSEGLLHSSISAAFLAGIIVLAVYIIWPMSGVSLVDLEPELVRNGAIALVLLMGALAFAYKGDPSDVAKVTRRGRASKDADKMTASKMFARDPRETGTAFNKATESTAQARASTSAAKRSTAGRSAAATNREGKSLAELQKKSGYKDPAASSSGSKAKPEAEKQEKSDEKTEFKVQGKIDGQYTINKIRSGGMGVVYIVTDDFSGKRYAVKSLRDEYMDNEEATKRFENEAKTWINLDQNTNIVQAMLFRLIEGRPLLFLEYIDGTDLDKILDMKKDFPLTQILDWAIQVCRGMAYAHAKDVGGGRVGIIHRDLKPANLMLTRNGVIKITDFGLAKAMTETSGLTTDKAGIGTPYYMPPEQLDDAKSVDKRADIYSFGAVLYEFLTGRPPFQSDNMSSLYSAIATKEPVAPSQVNPDVPEALDRITLRCLEKKRENRYASFEELEDELQAVAAAMPAGTSRGEGRDTSPVSSGAVSGRRSTGSRTASPASTGGMGESEGRLSSGKIQIEAIMFIDMVGSTDRGEIGDQLAFEIKEELDSYVRPVCDRRSCTYIKGTGDGYMVAFSTAADAINAARDIMRKVQTHNKKAAKLRRIDLRIGMNYGEVRLASDGDRIGQTVNMAARVEGVKSKDFHETRMGVTQDALTEKNRILFSERMFNEIKNLEGVDTRLIGYFDLKGFTGRHPIYELSWEE